MIAHVVLFRPKAGVNDADRSTILEAIGTAIRAIPSVQSFRVGHRILHHAAYEPQMPDFPYGAIVEFEDLDGLQQYLRHPDHARLGDLFHELQDAAMVYDFYLNDTSL